MRLRHRLKRIFNYEYWPTPVFYFPFIPVWIYYSLRSLDFLYFTRVNSRMEFGGFCQYSKFKILDAIPEKYTVKSYYFENRPSDIDFYTEFVQFPFIFKPDFGERGKNVCLIKNKSDFEDLYPKIDFPFILQEYCSYPFELGILYHRFPNKNGAITSIVKKEFLCVKGDGISTLAQLVHQEVRAFNRISYFEQKFKNEWKKPLPLGENKVLEEIGNHCRGTKFIDASEIISNELVAVFDKITDDLKDFHYGRFDLKVDNLEHLKMGKNIKIFELNGVNSEVAHIYDPKHSIFYAYKTVFKELRIVYRLTKVISKTQPKRLFTTKEFIRAFRRQLKK